MEVLLLIGKYLGDHLELLAVFETGKALSCKFFLLTTGLMRSNNGILLSFQGKQKANMISWELAAQPFL